MLLLSSLPVFGLSLFFVCVPCQGNNLNLNLVAMNLNLNLPGISTSGSNLHLSDLPSVSINSLERKISFSIRETHFLMFITYKMQQVSKSPSERLSLKVWWLLLIVFLLVPLD